MFVGSTLPTKDKTSKAEFLKLASRAYITCGKHLQAMLPLNNELLKVMSATDPLAHGHSVFLARLKRLPKAVGVSLTTEDRRSYEKETSNYQVDNKLPATTDSNEKVVRLDHYWSEVEKMGSYPGMCAAILPLIFIFYGPQVEGSFIAMGDIIDGKTCRTDIETYSAIQTVKYGLRARKATSVSFLRKEDILHDRINASLVRNMAGAYKQQLEVVEEQMEEVAAKRQRLDISEKLPLSKEAYKVSLRERQSSTMKDFFLAGLKELDKQVLLIANVVFLWTLCTILVNI